MFSPIRSELGNYDYLMGADLDFNNPEVTEELTRWGKWYTEQTGIDGYRLDAVKHINKYFYKDWLRAMKEDVEKDLFAVGEYWHWDVKRSDTIPSASICFNCSI